MKKKDEKNQEIINPYKSTGPFGKVPSWLKILLLKYWAAGAAFFFIGMGGSFLWAKSNDENSLLYLGLMLIIGYALMQEYVVKQIVRLMRNSLDDTYYYNMINIKGTRSFFLNLGYAVLIVTPIIPLYAYLVSIGVNLTIFGMAGIDPFAWAFAAIILDFIYLFIKNAINNFIKKQKYKKELRSVSTNDKEL